MIGMDTRTNMLFDAITDGDEDRAIDYINAGARLDWTFSLDNMTKVSVLHNAALNGRNTVVLKLCEAGMDVNAVDGDEMTALHYAATNGHLETLQLLKAKGAKLDAKTSEGATALHFAVRFGHLKAVKFLSKSNPALLAIATCFGDTPLHYSTKFEQPEILFYFLKKFNVDTILNTPDKNGYYPLHQLITFFDESLTLNESIQRVLDAGANPRLTNSDRERPSQLAEIYELQEPARILKNSEFPLLYLCYKTIAEQKALSDIVKDSDFPEEIQKGLEKVEEELVIERSKNNSINSI
jgi:ankyrin repeat protein